MRLFGSFLCLMLLSPAFAANTPDSKDDKDKTEKAADATQASGKKKLTVAHIEVKGGYAEGTTAPGLFGEVVETLGGCLQRLDKAGRDDGLEAVILHIDSPHIGWAKLNELRVGIEKLRKKGRKVFAWLESADTKDYLLATACDEIVLPESGMLMMPGLRAEVSFYKNLFDMLAIQPQMLRVGEFKSAAEPYSRS